MTFAVSEVGGALDAWRNDQQQSLLRFIQLDAALTSVAAPGVLLVYAFISPEPYLLICGLVCGLAALVMLRGAHEAKRGDIPAAMAWLTAGNWMAIITGALFAESVWPIYPLAALLPAVVAASYVRQDQFRRYLFASVAVATAATLIGLYGNITSIEEDVPAVVTNALQAIVVPVLTATLGFLALQNFGRVRLMVAGLTEAHEAVRFQANDLLASRSRMIAATDRERRRIERDLHDGTQQHFVALGMRLASVKAQLPEDAVSLREQLDRLRSDVRDAQRDLRDLTAAIYPPTLSQHGLTSAVRFIADRFTSNVTTQIDDVGRCDSTIEAAVYFTCMEALQNCSKHAGESAGVRIELHRADGALRFIVADDGVGFDASDPALIGGTANMHDRIGAVLGELTITSSPGNGTEVAGIVPVPAWP